MPYTPTLPPKFDNVDQAIEWIVGQFQLIAQEFGETTAVELRQVGRAPDKPREGMIVSANGTDWDPGSGAGAYEYKGGAWVKL